MHTPEEEDSSDFDESSDDSVKFLSFSELNERREAYKKAEVQRRRCG